MLDDEFPHSIGRVHACYGNFGVWLRALAYIRTLGAAMACAEVSARAVLNANYVLESLRDAYDVPHDRRVHARVRARPTGARTRTA